MIDDESEEVQYRCDIPAMTIIALYWLGIVGIDFIQPHVRIASSSKQMFVSSDLELIDLHTSKLLKLWLCTALSVCFWRSSIPLKQQVPASQGTATFCSKDRSLLPRTLLNDHIRQ